MGSHSRETLATFVKTAREAMTKAFNDPLGAVQRRSAKDRPVRGPRWVSKANIPSPPESDVLSILLAAIRELGDGTEKYDVPSMAVNIPIEWVGYRPGVSADNVQPPDMTEQAKYNALIADCKRNDGMTIMYMYGGAHFMFGPSTRRATATILSRYTGAQCVIVQHRLAPQFPFPSQLLDVLTVYLSLLYPPAGSFHSAVRPDKLVLAGDSSGAQLAVGVVQIILAAQRLHAKFGGEPTLKFHGRAVSLPLPAGIAVQSPGWGGFLPTWTDNVPADIFTDLNHASPSFPTDSVWPTKPPREYVYAYASAMCHPLVSPLLTTNWKGAPPLYIGMGGGEQSLDAARVVAQRAARQGVKVIWDEYELMPHNFPMVLPDWPQSAQCMETWAKACVDFVEKVELKTSGTILRFEPECDGDRRVIPIDVHYMTSLSDQDVRNAVETKVNRTRRAAREVMKKWAGKL